MANESYHEDCYTAMVTAASDYRNRKGHGALPFPGTMDPHSCSNTYSSANSSTSTGSNTNPSSIRYAPYHPGCQPLPANATASATETTKQSTSMHSSASSAAVTTTTTTKTYTHNPYSAIGTTSDSKDSSFDTGMDSYQSFQATYGDLSASSSYPRYQQHRHPHQPVQQPPCRRCSPQQHLLPQPRTQRASVAMYQSGAHSGINDAASLTAFDQPRPHHSNATRPAYAPVVRDACAPSSSVSTQFTAAIGHLAFISCTSFGRHLLISVLRLQRLKDTEIIYQELMPLLNTVALDSQGCHVVRTLIEFITTEQLEAMLPCFDPSTILEMATSTQNTRRALQAMFERHRTPALTPVVETIALDGQRLASTQQGCIAIMRVIEHGLPEQRQLLITSLLPALPSLTMNPYGNYVVQCILEAATNDGTITDVCKAFTGHWVSLSCDKYASNVMEKAVRQVPQSMRMAVVAELVFEPCNLQCLIQDGFGNFVLQAIITSSADAEEFGCIYERVEELVHSSPYGHNIGAKLRNKYISLFSKDPPRGGKVPKELNA